MKLEDTSRFLSLVLRHKPEKLGISLDKEGWTDVKILLSKLNITMSELEFVVDTNNKKRFAFNSDKTKIRASQGHSLAEVDIKYKRMIPPAKLYHGTAEVFVNSILKNGLIKGNRNYVHLSSNRDTAINVGSRHGKPVVFLVDALKMNEDGFEFFLSENNVWLTLHVEPKYLEI